MKKANLGAITINHTIFESTLESEFMTLVELSLANALEEYKLLFFSLLQLFYVSRTSCMYMILQLYVKGHMLFYFK